MENAVEGLYIAFGIMVFVLALSICISSFTQARTTVDAVITNMEQDEAFVKDANGNYLNYVLFSAGGNRTVSGETIIPTLYKSYVENFEVRFYGLTDSYGLPSDVDTDESGNPTATYYYIDSEKEIGQHANEEEAYKYLDNILNNNSGAFYKFLVSNSFTEKLGEYYQEDKNGSGNQIAEINKHKKRVIIYEK